MAHIRVLDLGIITAGAVTSQILADLGAEVIKIEAPERPDPFRRWTQVASSASGQADLNASPPFQTANRNKQDVALDLKHPEGRRLFLEMAAKADIVVENFRNGVLDRLGIGFDDLRKVKPDIILASLTSQGSTGPEAGYSSFGSTLDALGGLMSLTGYDAATPRWSSANVNYPDQVVSFIAPGAILAALRQRDRTGEAIHVVLSQREVVSFLIGEYFIDFDPDAPHVPQGNRSEGFAPQGVYPCQGEEQWIALSIATDGQWADLCAMLDLAAADDPRFATIELRQARHGEIDALLRQATAGWQRDELAAVLIERGIAAAAVKDAPGMLDDPQLDALGFFQTVESPSFPAHRQRGFCARFGRTPTAIRRPAPRLGEHSREVMRNLLGLPDDEVDRAIAAGLLMEDLPESQ
ncbi:CoA transferase [Sphingobium sp. Sx8-8]|uniref:CaiB/BaiF CoA transferase family protein n=1 Tax=Sphingobium sp. Sx8-8 TaxID=2933617 RepID=UPI001F5778A3|nr:CoA transferase [Sphingobium sp. Sx8-8]